MGSLIGPGPEVRLESCQLQPRYKSHTLHAWGYLVKLAIVVIRELARQDYRLLLSLGSLQSTFGYYENQSSGRRLPGQFQFIPPSLVSNVCGIFGDSLTLESAGRQATNNLCHFGGLLTPEQQFEGRFPMTLTRFPMTVFGFWGREYPTLQNSHNPTLQNSILYTHAPLRQGRSLNLDSPIQQDLAAKKP